MRLPAVHAMSKAPAATTRVCGSMDKLRRLHCSGDAVRTEKS